jgi:hypothetical protein
LGTNILKHLLANSIFDVFVIFGLYGYSTDTFRPRFDLNCSIDQVLARIDVVSVEYGSRLVTADPHCRALRNPTANHSTDGRPSEVVGQDMYARLLADFLPSLPKILHRRAVFPSKQRDVGCLSDRTRLQVAHNLDGHHDTSATVIFGRAGREFNSSVLKINLSHFQAESSRVTAADFKLMTTPYRRASDESTMTADQYWKAHPELAAERYNHDWAAIEREAIRRGEAEVARFLSTQLNYEPTANNKQVMLDYIEKHCNNQLTAANLFAAFTALKPQLAQSDKALSHGSTMVVDFGPRRENPSSPSTISTS